MKKIYIIISIIILAVLTYVYTNNATRNALSTIQSAATEYKAANGHYGIITNKNTYNCFSGNTFLKNKEVTEALTDKSIDNLSCQFEFNDLQITAWSVSVVRDEEVICEDSTGVNMKTPGLTSEAKCNIDLK